MGFRDKMLLTARACKPLLTKVIPLSVLKKMKKNMLERELAGIIARTKEEIDMTAHPFGVNLIGNVKGDFGLGQSTRLVARALEETGIPYSIYQYSHARDAKMNDTTFDHRISQELPYQINLVHINPPELEEAYLTLDKKLWEKHYNIAFWLWELEEFPDKFMKVVPLFQEIWTPAEFISQGIRKKTNIPVKTLPYCVDAPSDDACDREFFGLPEDKFLFLAMYDTNSVAERKNPKGIIRAFQEAFLPDNNKVGLVLKVNSAKPEDLEEIRAQFKEYDNIYLITSHMTKVEVNSLVKCVDVFVSLHRSEGYGLVLAEAMLLGTPTIATNWSANTEFADAESACLVGYELIPITEDIGPYEKGNHWADADLHQAAAYMEKLYEDPEFYQQISHQGMIRIHEVVAMERVAGIWKKALTDI